MPETHPNASAFPKGLSGPALRALAVSGIRSLDQLAGFTERDVSRLHGMGPKGVTMLRDALLAAGKHFKRRDAQMKKAPPDADASALIEERIAELGDWRGTTLAQLRKLILAADPAVIEEWKWGGPVWSASGIICTGETYKAKVKLTFAKGASLKDPKGLFNSSLDGNTRRAIDFGEGDKVNAAAFTALVREAVAANGGGR